MWSCRIDQSRQHYATFQNMAAFELCESHGQDCFSNLSQLCDSEFRIDGELRCRGLAALFLAWQSQSCRNLLAKHCRLRFEHLLARCWLKFEDLQADIVAQQTRDASPYACLDAKSPQISPTLLSLSSINRWQPIDSRPTAGWSSNRKAFVELKFDLANRLQLFGGKLEHVGIKNFCDGKMLCSDVWEKYLNKLDVTQKIVVLLLKLLMIALNQQLAVEQSHLNPVRCIQNAKHWSTKSRLWQM